MAVCCSGEAVTLSSLSGRGVPGGVSSEEESVRGNSSLVTILTLPAGVNLQALLEKKDDVSER